MTAVSEKTRTLVASLGRLVRGILAALTDRLELLLVELKKERDRFVGFVLLSVIFALVALMTWAMVTITIVIVCVRADRLDLLVGLCGVYLVATAGLFWRVRKRLASWGHSSGAVEDVGGKRACLS